MAKQTLIVGAGLSGLTLGRCLLKRGIPAVLYERTPTPAQHGYGITLHASTYAPLLKALDIDESNFKSQVAVDTSIGGSGEIYDASAKSGNGFRANRGKLEDWLREGLDVRWEHGLESVERPVDNAKPTLLHFERGQQVESDIVIAADGPHSALRQSVLPDSKLNVLPYVAYNGKRRIKRTTFAKYISPHINIMEANIVNIKHSDARINLSINDYQSERVAISWTYSRPSRGSLDKMHQPDRPLSGSRLIPEELFAELAELQSSLPEPFAYIFNPRTIKADMILHWLQRSILVPEDDLRGLAQDGIVLMGDAAHAQPIVGGNGANEAITDAVSLAEHIASGQGDLSAWIDARYPAWEESVNAAENNIESMHNDTSERL
jgi:2-polyprenyl-6-methoxyphenol hydroxylase-like FAD-dependent oxidoreductase